MSTTSHLPTSLPLDAKEARLIEEFKRLGSVIVAYSGGVDSSLLAYYARVALQERAMIVIAVSPSLAEEELDAARAQAAQFKWNLVEISTTEVDKPEYQKNDSMRCYFCKSTLFESLDALAKEKSIGSIVYGANVDDLSDFRPGHKAAREHAVLSPLQTAGLLKEEIRELARRAGLPSWDRPQAACLSSRLPTFVPVTIESLSQVEKAERVLHSLGFRQVRVRHHDDIARIEVESNELAKFAADMTLFAKISAELKAIGYKFVTLDMDGYKQGSANTSLKKSDANG